MQRLESDEDSCHHHYHSQSLSLEIGNYELMLPSRKIHSLLITFDLSCSVAFSILFILLDMRLKNKLLHMFLFVSIMIFPLFIIGYHMKADLSLHEADLMLRMNDFNWNRRE